MTGEAKDYALWFFWTMLLRMPLQPRGNIPKALQPILLFWKIPLGTIIKLPIYPSAGS